MELPAGTVTYVFTDIQGSTKLWEESPDAMMEDAAEILACVLADSVAAQKMINETATIGEVAQQLLEPLEAMEGLDDVTNAMRRGAGTSLEAGAHRVLSL